MSEQEMLQEIERLRCELAEIQRENDSLQRSACHFVGSDLRPFTVDEIVEMEQEGISLAHLLQKAPNDANGRPLQSKRLTVNGPCDEIETLRRELAGAHRAHYWLHKLVCRSLPIDDPDVAEAQLLEMMKQPWYTIDDIIEDLLKDGPNSLPQKQIPA